MRLQVSAQKYEWRNYSIYFLVGVHGRNSVHISHLSKIK